MVGNQHTRLLLHPQEWESKSGGDLSRRTLPECVPACYRLIGV